DDSLDVPFNFCLRVPMGLFCPKLFDYVHAVKKEDCTSCVRILVTSYGTWRESQITPR
ncbi:hypothetical protein MKX03_004271, partial [Papaver bracteatum]